MSLAHTGPYGGTSGSFNSYPNSSSHRPSSIVNFTPEYDADNWPVAQTWDDGDPSGPSSSDYLDFSKPLYDLSSIFGDTAQSNEYISVSPTHSNDTQLSATLYSSRPHRRRRFKDPSQVESWTGVHDYSTRKLKAAHTENLPLDGTEGRSFKVGFADETEYSEFVPWDKPINPIDHAEYLRKRTIRKAKKKAERASSGVSRSKYDWSCAVVDTATLSVVGGLGYGAWQFGPSAVSSVVGGLGSLWSGVSSVAGSLFSGAGAAAVESVGSAIVDETLDVGSTTLASAITSGVG